MTVPLLHASSISKRSFPSFHPSLIALSQDDEFFLWPTITLNPLSFRLSDCPGPWTPYPITAITSFFKTSRAFESGNSSLVTTFSVTPPKLIFAMISGYLIIISS